MEVPIPLCMKIPVSTFEATRFQLSCKRNGYDNRSFSPMRVWQAKQDGNGSSLGDNCMDCGWIAPGLSRKCLPHEAEEFLLKIRSEGFGCDMSTLSALMLCYANSRLLSEAQVIWDEILSSSFAPSVPIVSELIYLYATAGHFDTVIRLLQQIRLKNYNLLPDIFAQTISCFGKRGELELMEIMLKEMKSMGFSVDSVTGNAFVIYYSIFGSVAEMEDAYARLRSSRILIEEEAIRALSSAYIRERKFYSLGKFVENVGLGRRNVGNLLWNLMLLSYAANFKMKSLQREFVRMVEAGFHPDLTTFNIRALAFSKMSLFWDLHVSLEHMKHKSVIPDLVTYGCVVDAYLERRLVRNLEFALDKMSINDCVVMLTDEIVFEAMGKGDFHSSAEPPLEFKSKRNWTYKELIEIHLKKKYRSNQAFWNY
ncbi:hypothetical protein M9H77_27986 [Catharanthus roseus]|uniref:Uncharacterized protein n=1 Tax=Catharanthus roseus TaxID=4058 RepID=A0ACC0AGS6_CATRO|nr:hypothetical protein M9H77_27986 [Catharanthus roseus]